MIALGGFSLEVELGRLTHSFGAFMEPKREAWHSALNKTINANSLIEFNAERSTFFLHIAWQATELQESGICWLSWALLARTFQVAGRRQVQIVFDHELLLQRLKVMKCGGHVSLAPQCPWVSGLRLDGMGMVTQGSLDAGPSLSPLPFCMPLTFLHPHRGSDWACSPPVRVTPLGRESL